MARCLLLLTAAVLLTRSGYLDDVHSSSCEPWTEDHEGREEEIEL